MSSEKEIKYNEALNILSAREVQILKLIGSGYSSSQIAQRLFISIETVRTHTKKIRRKLGVEGSRGLIKWYFHNRPQ